MMSCRAQSPALIVASLAVTQMGYTWGARAQRTEGVWPWLPRCGQATSTKWYHLPFPDHQLPFLSTPSSSLGVLSPGALIRAPLRRSDAKIGEWLASSTPPCPPSLFSLLPDLHLVSIGFLDFICSFPFSLFLSCAPVDCIL